jgi:hypothetical protein
MHLPDRKKHPGDGAPLPMGEMLLALARRKAADIHAALQRDGAHDLRALRDDAADLQALLAEMIRLKRPGVAQGLR